MRPRLKHRPCHGCEGYGHHGMDGAGGYLACTTCAETGWLPADDDEDDGQPDEGSPQFDPEYADRAAADWLADRTSGPT